MMSKLVQRLYNLAKHTISEVDALIWRLLIIPFVVVKWGSFIYNVLSLTALVMCNY